MPLYPTVVSRLVTNVVADTEKEGKRRGIPPSIIFWFFLLQKEQYTVFKCSSAHIDAFVGTCRDKSALSQTARASKLISTRYSFLEKRNISSHGRSC